MAHLTMESPGSGLSWCDSHARRDDHPDVSTHAHISHVCLSRCAHDPGNIGSGTPLGDWSRSAFHTVGNGPAQFYHSNAPVFLEPQYLSECLRNVLVSDSWHRNQPGDQ